jgi:uncharacterized membrane protein YfcA
MSSIQFSLLVGLGLTVGILAGVFGIGGGVVMVPAMMFIVGFSLRESVGTSLAALLVPTGILGVIEYYKRGDVNILAAILLALGLFFGTLLGAKITLALPDLYIKRAFGVLLVMVGVRYLTMK